MAVAPTKTNSDIINTQYMTKTNSDIINTQYMTKTYKIYKIETKRSSEPDGYDYKTRCESFLVEKDSSYVEYATLEAAEAALAEESLNSTLPYHQQYTILPIYERRYEL